MIITKYNDDDHMSMSMISAAAAAAIGQVAFVFTLKVIPRFYIYRSRW